MPLPPLLDVLTDSSPAKPLSGSLTAAATLKSEESAQLLVDCAEDQLELLPQLTTLEPPLTTELLLLPPLTTLEPHTLPLMLEL